ncbi:hypothetical protein ACFC08_31280 [Streptomyces sp. NPDC056112]|uniref:hypothetical protein n=1 Tax=Streptomyces sp. NPDC056112 TaxID=3345715 RepID=UPI0035D7579E
MSAIRLWAQARPADRAVSVAVGGCDLLMCGVLLLMAVGVVGAEPTTREEETAAWHSACVLYAGWLAVGLVLFALLGMTRSLLTHVAMMLISPVLLVALMILPSLW